MSTTNTDPVTQRVATWFAQVIHSTRESDKGDLATIKLFHVGPKKLDELWSEDFESGYSPEDYARLIILEAESDAESMGGLQTYSLHAFYGRRKSAGRKCRFRIQGTEDLLSVDETSEGANAEGLLKQAYRHLEVTTKVALGSVEGMMRRMDRQLERSESRADALSDRHFAVLKLQEDLISQRQERELESLQAANKEKRLDEAVDAGKVLLPAIINRLAGKNVLPAANGNDLAIAALLDSVDAEQVSKIMDGDIFKPAQLAALMELIQSRAKASDEAKK